MIRKFDRVAKLTIEITDNILKNSKLLNNCISNSLSKGVGGG